MNEVKNTSLTTPLPTTTNSANSTDSTTPRQDASSSVSDYFSFHELDRTHQTATSEKETVFVPVGGHEAKNLSTIVCKMLSRRNYLVECKDHVKTYKKALKNTDSSADDCKKKERVKGNSTSSRAAAAIELSMQTPKKKKKTLVENCSVLLNLYAKLLFIDGTNSSTEIPNLKAEVEEYEDEFMLYVNEIMQASPTSKKLEDCEFLCPR